MWYIKSLSGTDLREIIMLSTFDIEKKLKALVLGEEFGITECLCIHTLVAFLLTDNGS